MIYNGDFAAKPFTTIPIPLKSFSDTFHVPLADAPQLSEAPLGTEPQVIELPLLWHPEFYPNDYLLFDGQISLSLPPTIGIRGLNLSSLGSILPGDNLVAVSDQNGLASKRFFLTEAKLDAFNPNGLHAYILTITRDSATTWYTYAVAITPLVLAVALYHLALILRRSSKESLKELPTFLVGLVAVFLTVLPLRAVLVSSELPGLTRIDLILGCELLLLVLVAVVAYLWIVWTSLSTNTR